MLFEELGIELGNRPKYPFEMAVDEALDIARRGGKIFRMPRGFKHPVVPGWQTSATTDPRQIESWFGDPEDIPNIGVATGQSGLVVIDVDGTEGEASFEELRGTWFLPRTYSVRTRRGRHLYFRAPTDLHIRSTVGALGLGLDVRGAGGLVVGPGSFVLEDKKAPAAIYRVICAADIADLPGFLIERLLRSQSYFDELDRNAGQTSGGCAHPETPDAIASIKEMLNYISPDCDYGQWRAIVWAILSLEWSISEAIARDWSKTAPHRFEDAAFNSLVRGFNPKHGVKPGIGTIVHLARQGGWGR
jgi:hypothetical protein